MKDKILITGSSGFIGTQLARQFKGKYHVVGLDQKEPRQPVGVDDFIHADFSSEESMRKAIEEVSALETSSIASVLHLAAYYSFSGEPSPKYEQITVHGTEALLRNLRGLPVEQFVFSSTMLVHAPRPPGLRIHEESPIDAKWDYPQSKVEAEQVILKECGTIPTVLLRIAGVYDDGCHSIPLANQVQRIYEKQLVSHVYPGDTSRGQSFIHLEDLASAFEKVVESRRKLPPHSTFLIGEPETLSYEELQRKFGFLLHQEVWETREIPKAVAKAGAWLQDKLPGEDPFIKPWMVDLADDHYALDITKARTMLGWEPRHSLRDTLPKMVEKLKADPKKWYEEHKLKTPSGLDSGTKVSAETKSHAA